MNRLQGRFGKGKQKVNDVFAMVIDSVLEEGNKSVPSVCYPTNEDVRFF
jgi:hypothetical protein